MTTQDALIVGEATEKLLAELAIRIRPLMHSWTRHGMYVSMAGA
jgi:hypothetical protein